MNVLHLTASFFFGGPERGIRDIAHTQSAPSFNIHSTVASFKENGQCKPFMDELAQIGVAGIVLQNDMPHLYKAYRELVQILQDKKIDIIAAHGHKARMLGWRAARKVKIPIVGVSRGWTWQDWKTSFYERIDQWVHHRMDKVIAVSQGQADKIINTGTPKDRVVVIHNAIDAQRMQDSADEVQEYRGKLQARFDDSPPFIIGAAGRLSPEKGYDILIDAFSRCSSGNGAGVVLFGEGVLREKLQQQIDAAGLSNRFKLAGFTAELDKFHPCFDLFVQSSHTEGFPCVNVEAMAAGVPVVATAVGGVPEQIIDGETGFLVPPNNPKALTEAIEKVFRMTPQERKVMGEKGKSRALSEFTCQKMAEKYAAVFRELVNSKKN